MGGEHEEAQEGDEKIGRLTGNSGRKQKEYIDNATSDSPLRRRAGDKERTYTYIF